VHADEAVRSVDEAAGKLHESLRRMFVSIPPFRNLIDGKWLGAPLHPAAPRSGRQYWGLSSTASARREGAGCGQRRRRATPCPGSGQGAISNAARR
jgi:hypothetical protein